MVGKVDLRQKIELEFSSGLNSGDDLREAELEAMEDDSVIDIRPCVAADFELGLESETDASCGCGCGSSCSGNSLDSSAAACSGCNHHG